eukprot:TRINITY_DN41188_c0_g1_i1.p1 TRINITY_DN41188_c0_g1~~TRINITY_DN41188_c0_g1_i1.p1  ORF type:complete len:1267 (+),score=311.19 TRINITY_DN41188_c0_g1_i1:129-3929(+)
MVSASMFQPTQQLQQERHTKVAELLQAASAEKDVAQRIKLLMQSQEILLKADTLPETVGCCLEYFMNLQADANVAVKRYAAHFLERLLLCKPSLALQVTAGILALLKDDDGLVRELAVKAAVVHHSRALYALSQEADGLQVQRLSEQLRQLQEAVRAQLETSSGELLAASTQWAQVLILAQTPSPLILRARVPLELRGIGCLEDLAGASPQTARQPGSVMAAAGAAAASALDLSALQQQAESMFELLCRMLEQMASGYDATGSGSTSRLQLHSLLSCVGSVARQRPILLPSALAIFKKFLLQQPPAGATANDLRDLVREQIQLMLASTLTCEWHAELAALLKTSGQVGSLEDLVTQAKYKQICAVADQEGDGPLAPRAKKRARKSEPPKHVWTPRISPGEEAGTSLLCNGTSAFDEDALLSGEAESTCRRFEDYFGLPSQREPAGHVPGPSLLATRITSQAELARIALTSLSSLSLQRSINRDRAHEKVVSFSEVGHLGRKVNGLVGSSGADRSQLGNQEQLLALVLNAQRSAGSDYSLPQKRLGGEEPIAAQTRDPRASMRLGVQDSTKAAEGVEDLKTQPLVQLPHSALQLPSEVPAKDALQQRLFEEVLESKKRMEGSTMKAGFSAPQLMEYDKMSRQVTLHLAAGLRTSANPNLQRTMCEAYILKSFDKLKAALQAAASGGPAAKDGTAPALEELVDLFHAKFATDVARWQESPAGQIPGAKPNMREILEAGGLKRRQQAPTGFTYAELFEMSLAQFEKREIPRRELRSFLCDLPAVPLSAFRALEAQCQLAGARKMALLTILALIEGKPACRWRGLSLLFKLAFSGGEDSGVRFDTIRLIINKIYSAAAAPMRWQLPHLTDVEAEPLLLQGSESEASSGPPGRSWDLSDPDFLPLQKLRSRAVEDIATMMLRSVATAEAQFPIPIKLPLRLEQLRADLFKGSVCLAKDRVWLYLALCIKRPVLLHSLVQVFTLCDADMKEHLINSIEEAIKYIPTSEQELVVLVQKAGPETEPLVLKVLTILMQTSITNKESLSPAFGEAVTRLYKETQNARLLVPVFDLLDRKDLLEFLPAVLQLPSDQVTDAFRQLVRSKTPPLTVTELLTELHHMNSPGENIIPIKCSMQALNIIFQMRDQFDPKVYGIVIQSLVEEPGRLPTLFMRTVIQVVKELPRLCDFIVMEILPRLVRQEVWGDDNMWRGFMIVLQHTFASQPGGAARVLAMLPVSQLEDVLVQHPDWKVQLKEFVARQPAGAIPSHVRQLLE